jgi:hypothetical protein
MVEVFCNLLADGRKMHENSENNLDGYVTDAFLLVLVRDAEGNIVRFALHNGSFLRDASGPMFECFSKSHLIVEKGIDQMEAMARSQGGARIMLRCPKPSELFLDGSSVTDLPWRGSLSLQEITLSSNTGHVLIRW